MANESKTPVDQILDLVVFAPLGLALTARDELPALIERGRRRMAGDTLFARLMGTHILRQGETDLRRRTAPAPPMPPDHDEEAVLAGVGAHAASAASTNGAAKNAQSAPRPAGGGPKPSADHLAIPGYDTLSASQVVLRLPGLDAEELEAVRAYEEATRGRRTILAKIGQLQSEA